MKSFISFSAPNIGMISPIESKKHDSLVLVGLEIEPIRTVRVPYGNGISDLPAGLGRFPVYRVEDFRSGVPEGWKDGFHFMPMYQSEAMWLNFDRLSALAHGTPYALIIAAGSINAVSGKKMEKAILEGTPGQNYVVIPPQVWLDGWKAADGTVYQFVAAPLGSGETVEGQLTGEETIGGIQFAVFEPKPGQNIILKPFPREHITAGTAYLAFEGATRGGGPTKGISEMGLGRGGKIRQKVYDDPYGVLVWNEISSGSTGLYIVNSADFRQITGRDPPHRPLTLQDYNQHGLPWFELYDEKIPDMPGTTTFDSLNPVTEPDAEKPGPKPDVFQTWKK